MTQTIMAEIPLADLMELKAGLLEAKMDRDQWKALAERSADSLATERAIREEAKNLEANWRSKATAVLRILARCSATDVAQTDGAVIVSNGQKMILLDASVFRDARVIVDG